MRIRFMVITIVFLAALVWSQERSQRIHGKKPSLATHNHKPLDVEVFRTVLPSEKSSTMENAYGVAFYRIEKDSLRLFQAFYGSKVDFDRVYYKWEDDTTVSIRLYNSGNKRDKTFKVFGRGATTGLIDH